MRLRLLAALAVIAIASGTARAQMAVGMISPDESGPGVQVSDGTVLHPGLALEGGYDSNVFYQNGSQNPIGSSFLRSIFHFDYASLPPQRLVNSDGSSSTEALQFRVRGYADFRHYFSSNSTVSQFNTLGLGFSPHAEINPGGRLSLKLYADYVRTSDPSNLQNTLGFVQDVTSAGFILHGRPGGGTLDLGLGANGLFDLFEAQQFQFANNAGASGMVYIQWNFLPRTALRADASWGLVGFINRAASGATPQDSAPLATKLSLIGLITPKLTINVNAGYGNSFQAAGMSYNGPIGGAQLDWAMAPQSKVSLGYSRSFAASIFANDYVDDHFYLAFQQLLGGRFVFDGTGGVYLREYIGVPTITGYSGFSAPGVRDDIIAEAHAALDYQIGQWLFTGLELELWDDNTNFASVGPAPVGNGSVIVPASFVKWIALAKLDASF